MDVIMKETREISVGISDCVRNLFDNRAATISFFNQLKETSFCLGQIIAMLTTEEDDEIQDLLRLIGALQMDIDLNDRKAEQLTRNASEMLDKLDALESTVRSTILSAEEKLPGLLADLVVVREKIQQLTDEREEIRNECKTKIVEAETRTAEVSQKYFALSEEFEKLKAQNAELAAENQMLKAQVEEQAKENREKAANTTRTLGENAAVTNGGANFLNPPTDDVKTAEYFIEAFEAMFKLSDQLVQVVKRLEKAENIHEFQPRALEEARNLRDLVHQGLQVFQRAKVEPKTLGSNLTAEVAAELKRIYDTMKKVKHNAERAKTVRK